MTTTDATDGASVTAEYPAGTARRHVVRRAVWTAVLLDALAIGVFVTIGRSSHDEGITVTGIASTLWPFAVGAVVGWCMGRVWRRPTTLVPGALSVWLGSIVVGMALREVAGQGAAISFVIVATCFLGACFFGWRLVGRAVEWSRQRRTA